jgi:hypothetical protein
MTNTTMKKIILSATTAMFLTACGGGGSSVSAADTASAKIQAYAENNSNPMPSLQDYKDAGVAGVTAANLDALNALVDSKGKADVDSLDELNALVETADTQSEVNKAPTANAGGDVSVEVNKAVELKGSGTDTDGTIASYKWTKGTIELGTSATLSYTPTAVGTDTLTLTVTDNDGATASDTVNVTVTAVADTNNAPEATPIDSLDVRPNKAIPITLEGEDKDSDLLTYVIVTKPKKGELTGKAPDVIYTPSGYQEGEDSFSFKVNDGKVDSQPATVTLKLLPLFSENGSNLTDNTTGLTWHDGASENCTAPKRVPTIEEFQTIVDYNRTEIAVIKEFSNIEAGEYKTSDGWKINLAHGAVEQGSATNTICVEGSNQISTITATVNADGNITTSNGLVWMDKLFYEGDNKDPLTYDKAKSICPTGWRLPTVVELDSIYDRKNKKVIVSFSKPMGAVFWTSTEGANHPKYNWTVNLNDNNETRMGVIGGANREENGAAFVRCVKEK